MSDESTSNTKKLESLTPEQEAQIPVFRQKWIDKFYNNNGVIDKENAVKQIHWLYKHCEQKEPKVMFMDSPLGCQLLIKALKEKEKNENYDFSNIKSFLKNINQEKEEKCYYGDVSDYGWSATYEYIYSLNFFTEYDWSNFLEMKKLLECGIFEIYAFETVCILCSIPKVYQNAENKLHREDGPAVIFKDGFSLYFWNGIAVPQKWIEQKNKITKKDISSEKNAEKRRCLREILGTRRFSELLGIEIVDSDKDDCGEVMNLWKTKTMDETIGDFIYFYDGICPSTKREYFICVPKCDNVWNAKAWTFKNQKIEVRHGDVGLLNLSKEFDKPICES